jgi:transcriptional regulator with XRE-family HTH domain
MPSRKGKPLRSPEGLALLYLRSDRGWTQRELAARVGLADYKQISRYEAGSKALHREKLDAYAAALGYSPEAVDALLLVFHWLEPAAAQEPHSPVALTPEEQRSVDRTVLIATVTFMEEVRKELYAKKREKTVQDARRKARELWLRLKTASRQDQRDLVAVLPEFQDWALAMHVCEASVRAAAHKPDEALHLADVAVLIASQVPWEEIWRSPLEGYCWAHVANARRVANDFAGADKAFVQAWKLWRASEASDPELLPEWLLHAMESSLRRELHQFPEALDLLEKAQSLEKADTGLILLQREHIYEQMGDPHKALAALEAAAPFIKASGEIRLLFALHFKTANHYCQLGHYQEVLNLLPQVRELAIRQGNDLDLIRVLWLEARAAAGQGRLEPAVECLEQVCRDFTARELPYDAARASLELATLYLEQGRSSEVRMLTRAMTWIFQAQGIARETLASLTLFCDAAQRNSATAELAQQVISELERTRPPAPLPTYRQRGRG